MSTALCWAESENWLALDEPVSDCRRRTLERIRPDRTLPRPEPMEQTAIGCAERHGSIAGPMCLNGDIEIGGPVSPLVTKAKRDTASTLTLLFSVLLHLGFCALAFALVPHADDRVERGGSPAHLDVLMIGAEEADELFEGARSQQASAIAEPESLSAKAEPVPHAQAPKPVYDAAVQSLESPLPPPQVNLVSLVPPVAVPRQDKASQETRPAPVKRSQPAERKAKRASVVQRKANPEAEGQTGEGNARATRRASQRGGTGGAAPVAGSASITGFRQRLVAHLTRYKNYPEQAQERGMGGRNAVTITLSREGKVLSTALAMQSGHSILDSATLAAVRRAQPFPAIPDGGPATFTVTIGLSYQLQ